ncbi:class C beta-lactamase-related serine hydrolase [Agromyces protaetiae]|uniref:Class C beta-lactamase-related serine hydrolase n=1 Tax=Agromyces protaetiae TaxID=2509455 RepID=A0A4P6FK59_9MICO|nr:class C beta-lactamase-related serine hydrolase [Agromyces protaetiae]
MSSRAIAALLDRFESHSIECHSLVVVRHGHVVAEGWWAPYSAERPHLLYSLTKSVTGMAVGLAIADGVLALDDRVVDVLPDHVPADVSSRARSVTVEHLLTMTAGHGLDSLDAAWTLEPGDLVRGFLRVPFAHEPGTRFAYDNAATFVLARMVERATGRDLADFLDERLFAPMGIEHAEWDRVGSGAVFGFHGLHLTTEALAAFGELLLRGGRWGDEQLVQREWVERATSRLVDSEHYVAGEWGADFEAGYGYQIWRSRHGFHGNGAFGQHLVVVPEHELVVAVTSAQQTVPHAPQVLDAVWECLLPGIDIVDSTGDDTMLAARLRALALEHPQGENEGPDVVRATVDASAETSAIPDGTSLVVERIDGGWLARFESLVDVEIGCTEWRENPPLGRALCARGAWWGSTFVADIIVITGPHRVRLEIESDTGIAAARWVTVPLTTADLALHLRSPLMTRPEYA